MKLASPRFLHRVPLHRRVVSWRASAEVVGYHIATSRWTAPPIKVAILTDLHVGRPWHKIEDVEGWVAQTNALAADLILVLGDILPDQRMPGWPLDQHRIAAALAELTAPFGVHVIMGNHDWADDPKAQETQWRVAGIAEALAEVGLPPMMNDARPLDGHGNGWLVGLDSQRSALPGRARHDSWRKDGGRHDPDLAFAKVPEGASVILLAHEPDYFAEDDPRPALQVSGHTHGGQFNFFGWRPYVPSHYGTRYAYGAHARGASRLVVSSGLGCTAVPLRIGQPPEIVVIGLTGEEDTDPWTT